MGRSSSATPETRTTKEKVNEHNQSAAELGRYARFFRKIRKASKRFIWRLKRGTKQTTKRERQKKKPKEKTETAAPVKPKPDFWESFDIAQNVDRIHWIYFSDIFAPENAGTPLVKSAFTELMICLRDLTDKADKFATRISFTDDIEITEEVYDVTELIKFVRDALCHIGIYNHFIVPDRVKASYNVIYGKGTIQIPNSDITLRSDYSDDVCFFFGVPKIYLHRHIMLAFVRARGALYPLLDPPRYGSSPNIVRY